MAAAVAMGEAKKNNNQLKVAAATVMETAKMTAMTTTMKAKATVPLMAVRHWGWQRAGGGKSAAEAGSAINIFQTGIVCCLIECFNLEEPIRLPSPHQINVSVQYGCICVLILWFM